MENRKTECEEMKGMECCRFCGRELKTKVVKATPRWFDTKTGKPTVYWVGNSMFMPNDLPIIQLYCPSLLCRFFRSTHNHYLTNRGKRIKNLHERFRYHGGA